LLILLLVAVRRAPTPHRWGTLPMRISPRARMRSPPRSRFFLLLVVLVLLLFRLVVLVRPDVGGVGHWARLFRTPLNPSFRPAAPRGVERLPLDDTLGSERLSEPRPTTQRRDAVGGGHASVRHFDAPVFRDAVVSGRSRVRFESDSFHGPGGPLQPLRTFLRVPHRHARRPTLPLRSRGRTYGRAGPRDPQWSLPGRRGRPARFVRGSRRRHPDSREDHAGPVPNVQLSPVADPTRVLRRLRSSHARRGGRARPPTRSDGRSRRPVDRERPVGDIPCPPRASRAGDPHPGGAPARRRPPRCLHPPMPPAPATGWGRWPGSRYAERPLGPFGWRSSLRVPGCTTSPSPPQRSTSSPPRSDCSWRCFSSSAITTRSESAVSRAISTRPE